MESLVETARIALAFAVGDWHDAAVRSERLAYTTSSFAAMHCGGAAQCYMMAGDSSPSVMPRAHGSASLDEVAGSDG